MQLFPRLPVSLCIYHQTHTHQQIVHCSSCPYSYFTCFYLSLILHSLPSQLSLSLSSWNAWYHSYWSNKMLNYPWATRNIITYMHPYQRKHLIGFILDDFLLPYLLELHSWMCIFGHKVSISLGIIVKNSNTFDLLFFPAFIVQMRRCDRHTWFLIIHKSFRKHVNATDDWVKPQS